MLELRYYIESDGSTPFADWFADLDATARAKVAAGMVRLEQGNLSRVKGVGEGVLEYRINFGPGYEIYFGRDGDVLVVLLTGGTKKRQQGDIMAAGRIGRDYRAPNAPGARRKRRWH